MTVKLFPTRARGALPAFGLLLALRGGSALVHADEEDTTATLESGETCSDPSLHGTYGFSFQGAILKADGTRASEFAGVGVETFDGQGAITSGRYECLRGQPSTPSSPRPTRSMRTALG
jgi:hypothetical protein